MQKQGAMLGPGNCILKWSDSYFTVLALLTSDFCPLIQWPSTAKVQIGSASNKNESRALDALTWLVQGGSNKREVSSSEDREVAYLCNCQYWVTQKDSRSGRVYAVVSLPPSTPPMNNHSQKILFWDSSSSHLGPLSFTSIIHLGGFHSTKRKLTSSFLFNKSLKNKQTNKKTPFYRKK